MSAIGDIMVVTAVGTVGGVANSITEVGSSPGTTDLSLGFDDHIDLGPHRLRTSGLELNYNTTGDIGAYIDIRSDNTYTDYGLRLYRPSGANSNSVLAHRGTGQLNVTTIEAGHICFNTTNTLRATVTSGGAVVIGNTTTAETGHVLDVWGKVYIRSNVTIEGTPGGNPGVLVIDDNDGSYTDKGYFVVDNNDISIRRNNASSLRNVPFRARGDGDGIDIMGANIWSETKTSVADDATVNFTGLGFTSSRDGLYLLICHGAGYATGHSGMFFSDYTYQRDIISGGLGQSAAPVTIGYIEYGGNANSDTDGKICVWANSSSYISIKNRIGYELSAITLIRIGSVN